MLPHFSTFLDYDCLFWQVLMLADEERNNAYRQAIRKVISGGEVVADVGAGTGVWGRYAMQCGAKRAYMVEREDRLIPMIRILNQQFSPGADIVVVHGDASAVELPEKVDIVISELLGGLAFDEGMVEVLFPFKKMNAKERCIFIPSSLEVWAQPVLLRDPNGTGETTAKLAADFRTLGVALPDQPNYWGIRDRQSLDFFDEPKRLYCGTPQDLKAPPAMAASWNPATAIADPRQQFGVAVWFDAEMGKDLRFCTGPRSRATAWGITVVPIESGESMGSAKIAPNVISLEATGAKIRAYASHRPVGERPIAARLAAR